MTVEQLVDVSGCASCLVKKMLVFETNRFCRRANSRRLIYNQLFHLG